MKTEVRPDTDECGICESEKHHTPNNKFLVCPHCDVPCPNRACTVCRQGMKGLKDIQ